ncbi:hypothetical protein [Halosimplex amylolyticum]|uniref:hypothetical protein n=1 Tax=Halosimplex amylolyticum TaxID=3396616 RepID=UPI003F573A6B
MALIDGSDSGTSDSTDDETESVSYVYYDGQYVPESEVPDDSDSSDSDSTDSDSGLDDDGYTGGGWADDPTDGMTDDETDGYTDDEYTTGGASDGEDSGSDSWNDSASSSDSSDSDSSDSDSTDTGGVDSGGTDSTSDSDSTDSGGLDTTPPETVAVGESYEDLNPDSQYTNPVDITRLHITEPQPMQGSRVPVKMEFTNRMDRKLSISEPVRINGQYATSASATIPANSTAKTTSEVPVPVGASEFTISVAGDSATRETSDYLGGRNLNLAPDPPDPGQQAHVYITWVNQIGQYIERTLPVKVNGNQVDTHSVSISGNGTLDDKITVTIPDGEQYSIDVGPAHVDGPTTASDKFDGSNEVPEQGTWTDDFEEAQGSTDTNQGVLVDESDVQDGEVVDDNLDERDNTGGTSGLDDSDTDGSSGSSSTGGSDASDPAPEGGSTGVDLGDFGDFGDFDPGAEVGDSGVTQRQAGMAAVALLAAAWAGGWL